MIGVNLVSFATRRRAGMEAREEADKINDFGRDPIGEGKEERVRSFVVEMKSYLDVLSRSTTGILRRCLTIKMTMQLAYPTSAK